MPISPARLAAFEILLRVEQQDAYASELLHSERLAPLSAADRGLCMELVMGVLRWRSLLDARIAEFSFTPFRKLDPQVLAALRLGAYQLLFLERIPARAAVNESVEMVKKSGKSSAGPLTNVVLRKIAKAPKWSETIATDSLATDYTDKTDQHGLMVQRRIGANPSNPSNPWELARATDTLDPATLARRFAHPLWLVERWMREYGPDATAAICRFDQAVPATSLRLRDAAAESELRDEGIELAPGGLLSSARRVLSGDVTHTRAYAEGRVTIQDEGSQLIALLVGRVGLPPSAKTGQMWGTNSTHRARILDCCAAPGGKTAAMADLNPESEIIAADLHEHRVRLMQRLVRAPNVRMIAADATRLPVEGTFDRVLADVPCSGTGTLARNPEIKWKLKPEDLPDLHGRQVAILQAAIDKLSPGGRLIYSSCSLEREENEEVVEEVLRGREDVRLGDCAAELRQLRAAGELELRFEPESLAQDRFLRIIPGAHPCDGFFAAVIEKP